MPNYEELYNIAKRKYENAISERDEMRRRSAELQGRKDVLTRELGEKQAALNSVKQKKQLVDDALRKCRSIISDEYPEMKKQLVSTGDEYKKVITSDNGAADLSSIYSADLANTKNELDSIDSDLGRLFSSLEGQETAAQNAVNQCSSELSSVTSQLNNVGSDSWAQSQANMYYAEMKEYETRWQNGE